MLRSLGAGGAAHFAGSGPDSRSVDAASPAEPGRTRGGPGRGDAPGAPAPQRSQDGRGKRGALRGRGDSARGRRPGTPLGSGSCGYPRATSRGPAGYLRGSVALRRGGRDRGLRPGRLRVAGTRPRPTSRSRQTVSAPGQRVRRRYPRASLWKLAAALSGPLHATPRRPHPGLQPRTLGLAVSPCGGRPPFFFFFYLRICETADISHWPSFSPGIISLENGRAAASGHSEEHCGDGRVAVRRLRSIAGQIFCRATTTKHKTNFKKPTKTKNPRLKIARQVRSESFRDADRALSVCGADLTSFTTDPGVLAAAPREVARLSESAGTGLRRFGSGVEAGPSRVRRSEVSLE